MKSNTKEFIENRYSQGVRDGIPIGLGYLSVSFTFGIMAAMGGLPVWAALLISMTNLTSAGQFAGLSLMLGGASYLEVAMTQVVINMRYALMSVSVSQKLFGGIGGLNRMGIAFGITDEIFAVSTTGSIGTQIYVRTYDNTIYRLGSRNTCWSSRRYASA